MPGSALPAIIEGPNAPSLGEQKHGRHHNEERERLDALEGGGRMVPADYMLTRSGTTYRLIRGLQLGVSPDDPAWHHSTPAGAIGITGREAPSPVRS